MEGRIFVVPHHFYFHLADIVADPDYYDNFDTVVKDDGIEK